MTTAILVTLTVILMEQGAMFGQDVLRPARYSLPCLSGKSFLRDTDGNPIVIEPDDLDRRATTRALLPIPRDFANLETVEVYLAIDETGRVLCASLSEGDEERLGAVGKLAIVVAKKWRFEPVLVEAKPTKCMGQLELRTARR